MKRSGQREHTLRTSVRANGSQANSTAAAHQPLLREGEEADNVSLLSELVLYLSDHERGGAECEWDKQMYQQSSIPLATVQNRNAENLGQHG